MVIVLDILSIIAEPIFPLTFWMLTSVRFMLELELA